VVLNRNIPLAGVGRCPVVPLLMINAPVEENVESSVAVRVVNAPAAGAVPPIAGGLARYVLNPVPLTVLDADSVVNAPAAAAVPPMAGGLAR